MKQPFWKLREFWTVVVDLVVSAGLYFGAKYLAPEAFDDLKWVIAALQPVAAFLMAHFAVERAQVAIEARVRSLLNR